MAFNYFKKKIRSLKVFKSYTGRLKSTLVGHTNAVNCVCVLDNLIVSGSTDKTVKIWNVRSEKCIDTLSGHSGQINAIVHFENTKEKLVCSGSSDKTIIIWNLDKSKSNSKTLHVKEITFEINYKVI